MAKMTEAQKRAALKYQRSLGQISIKLPKQELARYKAAAEKAGMPFRAWVLKQLKKAAICAALGIAAMISIGLTSRPAEDTNLVEITYTVQPGDTWWSIVERFREMDADDRYIFDYKQELDQLNKGADLGNLKPGQTLRIQYRVKN